MVLSNRGNLENLTYKNDGMYQLNQGTQIAASPPPTKVGKIWMKEQFHEMDEAQPTFKSEYKFLSVPNFLPSDRHTFGRQR